MMKLLPTLLALVAFVQVAVSPPAMAVSNLLLITVDDMNCDSIGSYGCQVPDVTPNIDRLATEGLSYDRAFVNIAICQPTRAVWMTGRYPHRNGALGFNTIRPDVPTLPESLRESVFYNALIGKHNHVVPSRADAFDLIRKQSQLNFGRGKQQYIEAVDEAIAAARQAEKPWFIMVNLHDPHRPFAGSNQEKYDPPPEFPRMFRPDEVPVPGFLPDLPPIRKELAEYFASVHRADDIVGGVLQVVDRLGERDNTLVLFTSDHGMPLPYAKTNCYYQSNHTPCIVRWPGHIEPGQRDTVHFVSGIDIAPTLLEVTDCSPLRGCDGKSLLPLWQGEKQPQRNHVFTMINSTSAKREYPMRAVQDEQYLYIWNGWAGGNYPFRNESQSGRTWRAMVNAAKNDDAIAERVKFYSFRATEEMYDLQADPNCLNNLLKEPNDQYSPRASAMTKRLWHWMRDTNDPQRGLFEQQVELALD
ncbi:sulfatase family protein [Aeoliella mucimassa]|uniref:Arylsulfatase n=1 Tax=Aeoliella mucimassa TaxID=2527972 RepID=A0A518AII8_9BACT|nr:sulfatase [Aeoliella mucimassa]QDU54555.1 Arylsulfatase [Aeoliella mucimassa]